MPLIKKSLKKLIGLYLRISGNGFFLYLNCFIIKKSYIECLKVIRNRKERTVYRLTLVADWNFSDVEGYAELIEIGRPDFIELKSVTYSGTSENSKLTMNNVPWH